MNKRKYYRLMSEYESIAKQKEYNDYFYDRTSFEDIRKELCKSLEDMCKKTETYIIHQRFYIAEKGNFWELAEIHELEKNLKRCHMLLSKIKNAEIIQKADYEKTFWEMRFFGIFTFKQYIAICTVVGISLVVIMGYMT